MGGLGWLGSDALHLEGSIDHRLCRLTGAAKAKAGSLREFGVLQVLRW